MTYEITQIKQWFIDNLGLRGEGQGLMLRVVDPVPEGRYVIPIGADPTPWNVEMKDGFIRILDKAEVDPPFGVHQSTTTTTGGLA
jgi:hypothetical protein